MADLARRKQKLDRKTRSRTDFADHGDRAALGLGQVFNDGKSQTGSPEFPGAGLIHAIKALKEPALVLRGDADAGIGDVDHDHRSVATASDSHDAIGRRVLDAIVDQIAKNLSKSFFVAADGGVDSQTRRRAGLRSRRT